MPIFKSISRAVGGVLGGLAGIESGRAKRARRAARAARKAAIEESLANIRREREAFLEEVPIREEALAAGYSVRGAYESTARRLAEERLARANQRALESFAGAERLARLDLNALVTALSAQREAQRLAFPAKVVSAALSAGLVYMSLPSSVGSFSSSAFAPVLAAAAGGLGLTGSGTTSIVTENYLANTRTVRGY